MRPDQLDPEETRIHELFKALRDHTVDAVDDFGARLRSRLEEVDRSPGPSPSTVVTGGLVQILNMVAWLFGGYAEEADELD